MHYTRYNQKWQINFACVQLYDNCVCRIILVLPWLPGNPAFEIQFRCHFQIEAILYVSRSKCFCHLQTPGYSSLKLLLRCVQPTNEIASPCDELLKVILCLTRDSVKCLCDFFSLSFPCLHHCVPATELHAVIFDAIDKK